LGATPLLAVTRHTQLAFALWGLFSCPLQVAVSVNREVLRNLWKRKYSLAAHLTQPQVLSLRECGLMQEMVENAPFQILFSSLVQDLL
jgi:hypothetical protein